jgi:hypothetical protein
MALVITSGPAAITTGAVMKAVPFGKRQIEGRILPVAIVNDFIGGGF